MTGAEVRLAQARRAIARPLEARVRILDMTRGGREIALMRPLTPAEVQAEYRQAQDEMKQQDQELAEAFAAVQREQRKRSVAVRCLGLGGTFLVVAVVLIARLF